MISGTYDLIDGAIVRGSAYFPPPVDQLLVIPFLIDTGASDTCISIADLISLSADAPERMDLKPATAMRGVGGMVTGFTTQIGLEFTHDDIETSAFELKVLLLLDPSSLGLPSLLGRDILFRGPLHFDPKGGFVSLDLPKGSFTL